MNNGVLLIATTFVSAAWLAPLSSLPGAHDFLCVCLFLGTAVNNLRLSFGRDDRKTSCAAQPEVADYYSVVAVPVGGVAPAQ